MPINLDHGYTIRLHPHGFRVCMLKSDPGLYYDGSGELVSDDIAKQAGFDVQAFAKERLKKARLAEARKKIEAEFAAEEERVAQEINREFEGDAGGEKPRYEVKHGGAGRYYIFDAEGKKVTTKGMTRAEAEVMLKGMLNVGAPAGEQAESEPEPAEGES